VLLAISFSQSEHSQDFGDSMIYIHCAGFWQTHNNATAQRAVGILPAETLPANTVKADHPRAPLVGSDLWFGRCPGLTAAALSTVIAALQTLPNRNLNPN
jgi:hypothetical protein